MLRNRSHSQLLGLLGVSLRHDDQEVVRDVTIQLEVGRTVAIVGRSGSGKTTLIRCLAGLIEPARGVRICSPSVRNAMVFQEPTLLPWLTVEQNIRLPSEIGGYDVDITALLDRFLLVDCRHKKPAQLSGGMQQRVALARALAYLPDVLLMDEPYRSLDESTRELMYDDLRQVVNPGNLAVLLVTHSLSEAWSLADRIFVLAGKPATLMAEYAPDRADSESEKAALTAIRGHLRNDLLAAL